METIAQLDSRLEDTAENDHNNEELYKLHSENIELRAKLKKLNKKLDKVIKDSSPIHRSTSGTKKKIRRFSANSEKKKFMSTKKSIFLTKSKTNRKITSSRGNFEDLEKVTSNLEEINKKLRRKIDQNIIESIDNELKSEFEKIQKYFRLIFKTECIRFHTKTEIEENNKRIKGLTESFNGNKPEFLKRNNKELENTHNDMLKILNNTEKIQEDAIALLQNIEKSLINEYDSLKNLMDDKSESLKSKERKLQRLQDEIKSIENLEKTYKRPFSPLNIVEKIGIDVERSPSGDIFTNRIRSRSYSNKELANNQNKDIFNRKSGKLQPLKDVNLPLNYDILKNTNIDPFKWSTISETFKNVNLSPQDFERTHNFTIKAAQPQH